MSRVTNKKVGECKISQDLNLKQYTLISYSPLWTFARLRVTTARNGHLPSLGWSPTNLKLVTHMSEVCYILGIWNLDLNHKTKTRFTTVRNGQLPFMSPPGYYQDQKPWVRKDWILFLKKNLSEFYMLSIICFVGILSFSI